MGWSNYQYLIQYTSLFSFTELLGLWQTDAYAATILFILQTCQFHYWMLCSFLRLLPEVKNASWILRTVCGKRLSPLLNRDQKPAATTLSLFVCLSTFCASRTPHLSPWGHATSCLTLHKHCPLWLITGSYFLLGFFFLYKTFTN